MTTLEKIGIQGIRSFGTQHLETLSFQKPLTLIVGHNGAGKTTIVECIKMACTGELPPNADKGKAFIYDPKLAVAAEVKAQIRLLFKTVSDKRICVIRSFQLTNSKDAKGQLKSTFKALESVIQTKAANGEMTSISQKCADMDIQVPQLMGVSKAILENVIFCHQDDNNWPLGAMGELKKKFDDLFGATRYTNALKAITETRKQVLESKRLLQNEVDTSRIHLNQAQQIQMQSKEAETSAEQNSAHITYLKEEEEKKRSEVEAIQAAYDSIQLREVEYRASKQLLEKAENDVCILNGNLQEVFQETAEQLQAYQQQFIDEMNGFQSDLWNAQEASKELENQLDALNIEIEDYQLKYSEGYRAEAMYAAAESEQIALFNNLKESLKDGETKPNEIEEYRRRIAQEESILLQRLYNSKEEYERSEFVLGQIVAEKNQLNSDKVSFLALMNRLEAEKKDLTFDPLKLQETKEKANEMEMKLQSQIPILETEGHENEIKKCLRSIDSELNHLQSVKEEMESQRHSIETENTLYLSVYNERETLKRLEMEQKAATHSFVEIFEANIDTFVLGCQWNAVEDLLGDKIRTIENSILQETASIVELETAFRQNEGEWNAINNQKMKLEDLRSEKEKGLLSNVIFHSISEITVKTEEMKEELENLRNDLSITKNAEQMYQNFLNYSIEKDKCIFCTRKFQKIEEKERMKAHIQKKISDLPSEINAFREEVEELQKQIKDMENYQILFVHIEEFKKDEENCKTKMDHLQKKNNDIQGTLNHLSNQLNISKEKLEILKALERDLSKIVVLQSKIDITKRDLSALEASLGTEIGTDDSKNNLTNKIKEMTAEENKLREKKEKMSEEFHRVQLERHSSKVEIQKLQNEFNEYQRFLKEYSEKSKKIEAIEMEAQDTLMKLEEMDSKVDVKLYEIQEASKVVEDKKHLFFGLQREIDSKRLLYSQTISRLMDLESQKNKANQLIGEMHLLRHQLDKAKNQKDIQLAELQENKKRTFEIEELLKQNRALQDNVLKNLDLKRKQLEVENERHKLEILEKEMGNVKIDLLKKQLDDQKTIHTKMQMQISNLEGALSQKMELIQSLKRQLNVPIYTNIEQKYQQALIAAETNTVASKDLSKYHTALNKALMRYHSMKMEEINHSIKELWQTVYTGQDIDYIAVRSDADIDDPIGTVVGQRSYNYRVVMVKNGVELDMRGRCSAGQKVLASLIIRLALAESFCVNCGILVLDEPTTNLDQYNIENLAKALSILIEARKSNRHFQLILITHDEEFILQLAKHSMCDVYYKIEKDTNGYSMIQQADIRIF